MKTRSILKTLFSIVITLGLCSTAFSQAPINDNCLGAISILCSQNLSGTTIGAAPDPIGICGVSSTAPGVWYSFVGNGELVTVSTCNQASYDTKISVFNGSCGSLICVTGNDDFSGCSGGTSQLKFFAQISQEYLILVHGFAAFTGNFTIGVSCIDPLDLGAADSFALLADSNIVVNIDSVIAMGDVGSYSGIVSPLINIHGTSYPAGHSIIQQALTDLATAQASIASLAGIPLSGLTAGSLSPGVYNLPSNTNFNVEIILAGDTNSIYIFNIPGNLTIGPNAALYLEDTVFAKHIYWNIAGDLTINTGSHSHGTYLTGGDAVIGFESDGAYGILAAGKIHAEGAVCPISHLELGYACALHFTNSSAQLIL